MLVPCCIYKWPEADPFMRSKGGDDRNRRKTRIKGRKTQEKRMTTDFRELLPTNGLYLDKTTVAVQAITHHCIALYGVDILANYKKHLQKMKSLNVYEM